MMGLGWIDEYPHSVFASVCLLDNKIENWKVGEHPKTHPGYFSGFWKMDKLNDYTSQYIEFVVNNDKEHHNAFVKLAPEWFKQWELVEDFIGSKPY